MANKNIGWQRILLLFFPYLLVVGLFQFVGLWLFGFDVNRPHSHSETLIISFFNLLGTFLILWIFMRFIDHEKFVQLGFQIKNRVSDFIWGVAIGAVIIGIGFVLMEFLGQILYRNMDFNLQGIIQSLLLFLFVALAEEILSRGYILRNLMVSFNKYIALIISALLFVLPHSFNPNLSFMGMLSIFLAGIMLGATYIFTKNLWFPIALHFSWNLFQSLLGFNVSGQDFYSLVEYQIPEGNIWNGGAFGFEGSILSVFAELIIICGIYYIYVNKANCKLEADQSPR